MPIAEAIEMGSHHVKVASIRRREVLLVILYLILLMALLMVVPGSI